MNGGIHLHPVGQMAGARRTATGWKATVWPAQPSDFPKPKPSERRRVHALPRVQRLRMLRDDYLNLPMRSPTSATFMHLVLGEKALQGYVECQDALTRLAAYAQVA
jgi:hypothetical protein